jgi:hypothetical protein
LAKQNEMLDLRRRTLRSHASVLFDEPDEDLPEMVTEAIKLACDAVEQSRSRWHARLRPVAADLWICQIAVGLGFEVEKLVMVRRCPVSLDLVRPHLGDLRRTRFAETASSYPSH